MNYKRIIAARIGSGTVFELEDGIFALVDHEVSRDCARYSVYADAFLRHGYFDPVEQLPEGNCDEDVKVLLALKKPDNAYGFGEERLKKMLAHREQIYRELNIPTDQVY